MGTVTLRDDMRTMFAAAGGLAAQFTEIELALKIVVALLTCVYLGIRIWKAAKSDKGE